MKTVSKGNKESRSRLRKVKKPSPQLHFITGELEDYQTFRDTIRYPNEALPVTKANVFRTVVDTVDDVVLEDLKKVDFRGSDKPVTPITTDDIKFDLDLDIPEDDNILTEENKQEVNEDIVDSTPPENTNKKTAPKTNNKKLLKPPKPKKEGIKREKGESLWQKIITLFKSKPKPPKEPKKPRLPKEPKKPNETKKKPNSKIGIKVKPPKSTPQPPKPKNKLPNKKVTNKVNEEQALNRENDTISNLLNSETYRPGNNIINKNDKVGGGHDE